ERPVGAAGEIAHHIGESGAGQPGAGQEAAASAADPAAPTANAAGRVSNHARPSRTTPRHFTLLLPPDRFAPTSAPDSDWVMLTGAPTDAVPSTTAAPDSSVTTTDCGL